MTISMYHASIPVIVRILNNLIAILRKAAAHAEVKKIDPAVLVHARLYPDMFPLARQVQIASDVAKGCPARLTGGEPPKYEDTESTFPELIARLEKTITFLQTFKPSQIDGSEARAINMKVGGTAMTFKGMDYLSYYVLPNVFFHVTTAYDILRHNGVEVGKRDFLGEPPQ